jgi:transmembrane sensor
MVTKETNNSKNTNDNVKDELLTFYVKRALLEDAEVPDVNDEFNKWKSSVNKSHKNKTLFIRISTIAAAACILLLMLIHFNSNLEQGNEMTRLLVYKAQTSTKDIEISVGGKIAKVNSTTAYHAGFSINKDNVITFQPEESEGNTEPTTLTIPQGKVATIILADGTKVWMSADTKLIFPKHFEDNAPREVKLYGEAYFEVKHDDNSPFIVDCGKIKTTVLGTKFNIKYFDNEQPRVTLLTGKVKVSSRNQNVILLPEQDATLTGNDRLSVTDADIDVATSWRNGEFFFDGQTTKEIMMEIGRWYNMDVVFTSEKHMNDRLHFNGERTWSVKEIVEQLNLISDAKIEIKDNILSIN